MDNKITFEQIKEFLEFVLRNVENLSTKSHGNAVEVFNNKKMSYFLQSEDNDETHIRVSLYDYRTNEFGTCSGTCYVKVSDTEALEFNLLNSKIREAQNKVCVANFNIKFF